jgi:hypothetical protein
MYGAIRAVLMGNLYDWRWVLRNETDVYAGISGIVGYSFHACYASYAAYAYAAYYAPALRVLSWHYWQW